MKRTFYTFMTIFSASLLMLGFNLGAQTTATTTSTNATVLEDLKESPFDLFIITESYGAKRKNSQVINKIHHNLFPFLSYDITDDTTATFYPKFTARRSDNRDKIDYDFDTYYATFKISHNFLKAQDVGFDFSADARYYNYLDDAEVTEKSDGRYNVRTYLSRSITDKWTIHNQNRLFFYDNNEYKTAKTRSHYHEFRLINTFQVSSKFSTSLEFRYINDYNKLKPIDTFYIAPAVSYDVNDKLNLYLDLFIDTFKSSDNKTFANSRLLTTPTVSYKFTKDIKGVLYAEIYLLGEDGKYVGSKIDENIFVELDFEIAVF